MPDIYANRLVFHTHLHQVAEQSLFFACREGGKKGEQGALMTVAKIWNAS